MNQESKIYVAGHTGLVGSAIVRCLKAGGYGNLVLRDISELDLTDPSATNVFFAQEKPEYVFIAAAKVGGIVANNTYPADFIRINLQIELNLIDAAYRHGVKKLLFLGSSCIYPKFSPQPMKEEHLLAGKLEPTNDAYAIAKISGIILCKSYNRQHGTDFIAAMPTNLYGPNDNFDLQNSHVLPAMMRKFHEAKQRGDTKVELWGSGLPRREMLYVDDLADALLFVMLHYNADPKKPDDVFLNIGVGEDLSIKELASLVKEIVGYRGEIVWNTSMPDGMPRKVMDVSRLTALGWKATTRLEDGIRKTYEWYLRNNIADTDMVRR
jgi:GDP-L-fucose synthase